MMEMMGCIHAFTPRLTPILERAHSRAMKLIAATAVYLFFGTLIGVGIVLAARGSGLWFLLLASAAFTYVFAKVGCATH